MLGLADYLKGRVREVEGHWLWTKTLNGAGYGLFTFKGKVWMAHRASYTVFNGVIPEATPIVVHKKELCTYMHCINPDHLMVVTKAEWDLIRREAGWGKRPSKIPIHIQVAIREHYANGTLQRVLAEDFNLSIATISKIVRKEVL